MHFAVMRSFVWIPLLVGLSACSGTSSIPNTPTPGFNNVPNLLSGDITHTGAAAPHPIDRVDFDILSDRVAVGRAGAPDVVATGAIASHPRNADLRMYETSHSPQGEVIIGTQTSRGEGYAVAYYNGTGSAVFDPEASVMLGGNVTGAAAAPAIAGAMFVGDYLGYVDRSLGAMGNGGGPVTGDVQITVNATGTGIMPGPIIQNRIAGSNALYDVTTSGGPINGDLVFSDIPLTTQEIMGLPATGTMDGGFFDQRPSTPSGELVGTVILQGGIPTCNGSGNIAATGSDCVLETGVFIAD